MFGSKGWKRRRFYLSGSVLRYFKSQKELDAFEAGFGSASPASPAGKPQLAADALSHDATAGNAAGQGPTELVAVSRSKSLNLIQKFPVVDSQASSGRTAPSIRRRRVQSSGAAAALTPSPGSPLARAADPSQSSGPGTQSVPPTLPPAAAGGSSGGNGSGTEASPRLRLGLGLGLGPAAGGAGGAGPGSGAGPGTATGSGRAGSEASVTSAGAQSPTTTGAVAGLGAIVVYGGWMRRLRGYEEATRNHVLLLLPPLGHRVYFVSAESELELQGWERALRLGGMRDVPPDDDSELPPG